MTELLKSFEHRKDVTDRTHMAARGGAAQGMPAVAHRDWRRVAARMRAELERAELDMRTRKLAMWAIKPTLLRGRISVVIPNRARVCAVLGIGQNHIGTVAEELAAAGIATLKAVHEGWELTVYADSKFWTCGFTWQLPQMNALLAEIDGAPGQVQGELLEADPCLDRARAEVAAENAERGTRNAECPERGTSNIEHRTPNIERRGDFPKREVGVPEMGNGRTPVNSTVTVHSGTAIKQLSSEQLQTRNAERGTRNGPSGEHRTSNEGMALTREEEADAMERLRRLVGDEDVNQWGGDWRKNWLRKHPQAFTAALNTLLEESQTGWRAKKSPGAALKDLTRRYAQEV